MTPLQGTTQCGSGIKDSPFAYLECLAREKDLCGGANAIGNYWHW